MKQLELYFEFLRYCIEEGRTLPKDIGKMDWQGLYDFASQQSLLGVCFYGITRNPVAKPERKLLLKWFSVNERIKLANLRKNKATVELTGNLTKDGFKSCILKGQGNTLIYPSPYIRMSGDIDVWVIGGRKRILSYIRQQFPDTVLRYHHVEYPIFQDVNVEVHFFPFFMNNPFYNHRLQMWFEIQKDEQFSHFVNLPDGAGQIAVPTTEFNVVYQLSHLMHHFFDEGIGLRQMMDYYYVLKTYKESHSNTDSSHTMKKEEHLIGMKQTDLLKYLGLRKFAGAVMYVMQEVFGIDNSYLIVPPDTRRGKTLLKEILKGGNFGKHSGLTKHNTGTKYFLKIERNLHFVREYPAEALCEPLFRTYHFFWRITHS